MSEQQKTNRFQRRSKTELVKQTAQNSQISMALAQKVFELEKKLNDQAEDIKRIKKTADHAGWRARALAQLAPKFGIEESLLEDTIAALQNLDYDSLSDADDKNRNLEIITEGEAQNGMIAVRAFKFFKGGNELRNERLNRSKAELGQNQVVNGVDELTVGMKIGETKRAPLELQGITDEVEITLIGLRKLPAQQAQAQG